MLEHLSEFPSFSGLKSIPSDGQTTFCLSVHPSVDPQVAPILWLFVNNAAMNMGA